MTETTLDMLTALVYAYEGCVELNLNGIHKAWVDDNDEIFIEMQDGRVLRSDEADQSTVDEAIIQWRQAHPAFFQRILGAMM